MPAPDGSGADPQARTPGLVSESGTTVVCSLNIGYSHHTRRQRPSSRVGTGWVTKFAQRRGRRTHKLAQEHTSPQQKEAATEQVAYSIRHMLEYARFAYAAWVRPCPHVQAHEPGHVIERAHELGHAAASLLAPSSRLRRRHWNTGKPANLTTSAYPVPKQPFLC